MENLTLVRLAQMVANCQRAINMILAVKPVSQEIALEYLNAIRELQARTDELSHQAWALAYPDQAMLEHLLAQLMPARDASHLN